MAQQDTMCAAQVVMNGDKQHPNPTKLLWHKCSWNIFSIPVGPNGLRCKSDYRSNVK